MIFKAVFTNNICLGSYHIFFLGSRWRFGSRTVALRRGNRTRSAMRTSSSRWHLNSVTCQTRTSSTSSNTWICKWLHMLSTTFKWRHHLLSRCIHRIHTHISIKGTWPTFLQMALFHRRVTWPTTSIRHQTSSHFRSPLEMTPWQHQLLVHCLQSL